jgi:hypothetical protein
VAPGHAPIRWERHVSPAAWLSARLRRSRDVIPDGFEAYARLRPPPGKRLNPGIGLAMVQRRPLVEVLRGETATPERCWFCFDDRRLEIDTQGVRERVEFPDGNARYLLHGGPIERALLPPPQRPLPAFERDGGTLQEFGEELREKLAGYTNVLMGFSAEATPAAVKEALASLLDEVTPSLWWPEDRAWFVSVPGDLRQGEAWVAGSHRLIDRLLAHPELGAVEETLPESRAEEERRRQERTFGPVVARGQEGGLSWTMRARIAGDEAWYGVDGSGGGGGPLPFADIGWKKLGHFGAMGWSSGSRGPSHLAGVVSKHATSVEVHLATGAVVPARIIDTGDPRASFFIAFWSSADWAKLVARDARGEELETVLPSTM